MAQEKETKKVKLVIDVSALKAAARSAERLQKTRIAVPMGDPSQLSVVGPDNNKIYTLEINPVDQSEREIGPDTFFYVAVKSTNIHTLANNAKEGCITVNGTLDIPLDGGLTPLPNEVFFLDEESAREVAKVLTQSELEKVDARITRLSETFDSLDKQLKSDIY